MLRRTADDRAYRGPDRRDELALTAWWPTGAALALVLPAAAVAGSPVGWRLSDATALAALGPVSAAVAAFALVLTGIGLLLHRATGEARALRLANAGEVLAVTALALLFDLHVSAAGGLALAGYCLLRVATDAAVDTSRRPLSSSSRTLLAVALVVAAGAVIGELPAAGPAVPVVLLLSAGLCLAAAVTLLGRWRQESASLLQVWAFVLVTTLTAASVQLAVATVLGVPGLALLASGTALLGIVVAVAGCLRLLDVTLEQRRGLLHLARVDRLREERDREQQRRALGHEVRNALTGLQAAVYALRRSAGDEELRTELIDALALDLERLRGLILPGGAAETSRAHLADVLVPMVMLAREQDHDVVLDGDLAASVALPAGVLAQVVDNLVTNAVRHGGGAQARVRIELARGDDHMLLRVSDAGPGIPPGQHEQVFLPGIRLGPTGGDGLGLTISRDLLRAAGGDLWLEPTTRGASFAARLPLAATPTG